MNRKKLLIIAKILINGGILCLLLLCLPVLSYWVENNPCIVLFALALILIGCFQCIIANKNFSEREPEDDYPKRFPMIWYFKTIKSMFAGIAIGLICEVAIPYYKNSKDKPN